MTSPTGGVGFGRAAKSYNAFEYPQENKNRPRRETLARVASAVGNDQTAAAMGLAVGVSNQPTVFDKLGGVGARHIAGAALEHVAVRKGIAQKITAVDSEIGMARRIWQNNTYKPFTQMFEGKNIGSGIVHSLGLGLLGVDTLLTTRDGYRDAQTRHAQDASVNVKAETAKTFGKTLFKNTTTWFAGGAGFALAVSALPQAAILGVSASGIVGAVAASVLASRVLDKLIPDPPKAAGQQALSQADLPEEDRPILSGMTPQQA